MKIAKTFKAAKGFTVAAAGILALAGYSSAALSAPPADSAGAKPADAAGAKAPSLFGPAAIKHGPGPDPARLPDGKPNWTGFWITPGGLMDTYRGPSGLEGVPKGINAALFRDPRMPKLKSPYKEEYEHLREELAKGPVPSKIALCYPPGMPGMMIMIYGMEILQTPKIIALSSEWQAASRRIWLDVKEHPSSDELEDTYTGHSIGHWEGDVLVVDTVGIRPDVPVDLLAGLSHSEKLHIVERFHQTAPDVLVDDLTIIDPDVFEKPWITSYTYQYKPDLRIEEYVCLDNNRNVDSEGRQKF